MQVRSSPPVRSTCNFPPRAEIRSRESQKRATNVKLDALRGLHRPARAMGLQRARSRPSGQDIPVDPRLARRSGAAPSTSPQTSTPLVAPQPRQGASAGLSADTEPRAASAGVSRAPELSWVEQKRAEQRAASARPYGVSRTLLHSVYSGREKSKLLPYYASVRHLSMTHNE